MRDDVRDHVTRLGLDQHFHTDAMSRVQITMLDQLLRTAEAAMTDLGIDPHTRRQVLDRVLYGGTPSAAEAEQRIATHRAMVERLSNNVISGGNGSPALFDPATGQWMGGGGGAPNSRSTTVGNGLRPA